MNTRLGKICRQLAFTLTLGLAAAGSAHAGLVTGSVDPEFGSVLPGLSYRQDFSFYAPDSCFTGAPSGLAQVSLFGCGGPITINMDFTIYKTATPTVRETVSTTLLALSLSSLDGFAIGAFAFNTQLVGGFVNPELAAGKRFGLLMSGPYYVPEIAVFGACGWPCYLGMADKEALEVTVFHKDDLGVGKLGQDALGNDIGYHIQFVNGAPVLTTTAAVAEVPEPASLALLAGGLLALGLTRRLRRRGLSAPG